MYDHMFIRKWTSQEDIYLFPTEGESNPSYDAYDEDIGVLKLRICETIVSVDLEMMSNVWRELRLTCDAGLINL